MRAERKTYTNSHEVDGDVDAAQRGHIHRLQANHTGRSDTGRVLTGTAVLDGINQNLDGVLAGDQTDDLEGLLDDLDGLAVEQGEGGHRQRKRGNNKS